MEELKDILKTFDFNISSSDSDSDDAAYKENSSNESFNDRVVLLKDEIKIFKNKEEKKKDNEGKESINNTPLQVSETNVNTKVKKEPRNEDTKVEKMNNKNEKIASLFDEKSSQTPQQKDTKNKSIFMEIPEDFDFDLEENTSLEVAKEQQVVPVVIPVEVEKKSVKDIILETVSSKAVTQKVNTFVEKQIEIPATIPTPVLIQKAIEETEVEEKSATLPKVEVVTNVTQEKDYSKFFNIKNYKFEWNFKSKERMFDNFYFEKVSILNKILKGIEIPFEKYKNDLIEASVAIPNNSHDLNILADKMAQVQNHREVIKNMRIQVNFQYFLWDRAMPMMQGVLARIYSEKPASKQEGVTYEHLNDMEVYHGNLKAVYHSAEMVSKTLDDAFFCLSRQVTIVSPTKQIERYTKQDSTYTNVNNKFTKVKDDLIDDNESQELI